MAETKSSRKKGGPGKTQSAEQEQDERQGFWRKLVSDLRLPFLFSIPAFIFGIVVFWENHHEDFHPGSAYLNAEAPTRSGFGIHLSVTNNGDPPVVIDRASLDFPRAQHNANIYFYLSDPRVIDNYSTDPSRVSAERHALPIAVDSDSAQTVVLLADPRTFNTGRIEQGVVKKEQAEFCDFIHKGTPRPTLRLHIDWSGLVLSDAFPFLGAPDTESLDVRIAGSKVTQPSWSARLAGRPGSPTSVRFSHQLAESSVGALAKMTLYRRSDSNPIYELERPLVGPTPTAFRLPRLGKGTYLVAFSVDGDVVVTARLPIPAPRPRYDLARTLPPAFCGGAPKRLVRPGA
jgi:hypothetical protein